MEVEIWDGGLENTTLKFTFLQKSGIRSSWEKERWWAACSARLGSRICREERRQVPQRLGGAAHSSSHWGHLHSPRPLIFPLGGSWPRSDVSPLGNVSLSSTWGQHRTADGVGPPQATWSSPPLGRSPLSLPDLSHPCFWHPFPTPPQAPVCPFLTGSLGRLSPLASSSW